MNTVLGYKSKELIRFYAFRLFIDAFLFMFITVIILTMLSLHMDLLFYSTLIPFIIIPIADAVYSGIKYKKLRKRKDEVIVLNGDILKLCDKNNNCFEKNIEGIMVVTCDQKKRLNRYGVHLKKYGSLFIHYGDHTVEIEEIDEVEEVCRRLQNIVGLREKYAFNNGLKLI